MTITNEQRDRRKSGIFASDVPRIMSGQSIPLILEKLGEIPPADFDDVIEVEIGHVIESKIIDAYEAERPGALRRSPDTMLHREHEYLGTHLDCLRRNELLKLNNVEAKSVGTYNRDEWGDGGDEVPDKVLWQVQTQTLVASSALGEPIAETEIPVCFVTPENLKLLLTGRLPKIHIFVVPSDSELQAYIVEKTKKIWNCIQTRELPDPENLSDVRLLYRKDTGEVIQADEDLVIWWDKLVKARADEGIALAVQEEAKLKIQSYMKSAAEIRHNGKTLVTWKLNKGRKGFSVAPVDPFRVFLVKDPK